MTCLYIKILENVARLIPQGGVWVERILFVCMVKFLFRVQFPTLSCLVLYFLCVNLFHSLIMWLIVSSLSPYNLHMLYCYILTLRPSPKMLFQGDTPEESDTFQWPVIERDRVGGLRLMRWDKVKVPLCHYSDALEESNLGTAWQLFPLDDD